MYCYDDVIHSSYEVVSLAITSNKSFYVTSNLYISTAPYTPSNKSSKVSPSKSWVQLFLRLFLIFFRVNLIITFGLN